MYIKNIFKLAAIPFLILSLSCTSNTNCIGLGDLKQSLLNITHRHNKTILPYNSFVKLTKEILDNNNEPIFGSVASGFIVKQEKYETKIVTAKHFCDYQSISNELPKSLKPLTVNFRVIDVSGTKHEIKTFYKSKDYDICLIVAKKINNYEAIELSPVAPKRGEKVFNIAAPLGISDKKTVLLFEGYYAGDTSSILENEITSLYTIPVTGGSSGSAIVNEHGELIGIVFAGTQKFENVCMAVPYLALKDFLKETKIIQ